MRLKITGLGIILLIFLKGFTASGQDTLTHMGVFISCPQDSFRIAEQVYTHPLFADTDVKRIYICWELDSLPVLQATHVIIELKKQNRQAFRLKPIFMHDLLVTKAGRYLDSLDIPDGSINSGNYSLTLKLKTGSMGVQLIGTRSLQLLRSGHYELQDQYEADEVQSLPQNKALPLHSFVERYDLKQLKRNVAALAPMANRAEAKTISVLQDLDSLDVLQLFFYNFWYSRLPDNPSKAWQDYAEILNEVARLYGGPGLQGYESDRGRVYIRYGPPDRVVKAPNEKGALPYEVWFYYQSGLKSNLKFLFFQPGMLSSQMILLNTNIPEEGINPNWKNMILQDPTNPDNKLMHKVFEFFN